MYKITTPQMDEISEKREAALNIRNTLNIELGKTTEELRREEIKFLLKRL